MSVLVKICGLSTRPTLDAALDAGADLVGFVFFEPSPRHVPLDLGSPLSAHVAGRARKVVLTVDADDATLAAVIEVFAPDLLQLHGSETPERVGDIRKLFGLPVIKALGLNEPDDLRMAAAYAEVADHLLFDAKPPPDASRPGGNGASFDWHLLRGFAAKKPWLLAGGLTPDRVAEALVATGAPGLDVSSGVESTPGVKDIAKIQAFLKAARSAPGLDREG
jgi:phosphoribosylanthranilate isomerase